MDGIDSMLVVDFDVNWLGYYSEAAPNGIDITYVNNYQHGLEEALKGYFFLTIVDDDLPRTPNPKALKVRGLGRGLIKEIKLKRPDMRISMITGGIPPLEERLPGVDYQYKYEFMENDKLREYLFLQRLEERYKRIMDKLYE